MERKNGREKKNCVLQIRISFYVSPAVCIQGVRPLPAKLKLTDWGHFWAKRKNCPTNAPSIAIGIVLLFVFFFFWRYDCVIMEKIHDFQNNCSVLTRPNTLYLEACARAHCQLFMCACASWCLCACLFVCTRVRRMSLSYSVEYISKSTVFLWDTFAGFDAAARYNCERWNARASTLSTCCDCYWIFILFFFLSSSRVLLASSSFSFWVRSQKKKNTKY